MKTQVLENGLAGKSSSKCTGVSLLLPTDSMMVGEDQLQ